MRGGGNDPAGQASYRRPARPGSCRHTLIVLFGLVNFCGRALGSGRSVTEGEDLGRSRRSCATGARCAVTHAEGHRRVGFARGTFTGAGRAARAAGRFRHTYPITIPSSCSPTSPARDCAQARLVPRARRGSLPTQWVRRISPDQVPPSLGEWASSEGLCPPVPPLGQRRGPGPAAVWPGLLLLGPVGCHDRGELLLDPVRVEKLVLGFRSWVVFCCRVHRDHLTGTDDERGTEAGG